MGLREFLNMGGYGGYVWTSYGLTTLVLLLNWTSARRAEAGQKLLAQQRTMTNKENRT
jgi:heme exporter protein CcmD